MCMNQSKMRPWKSLAVYRLARRWFSALTSQQKKEILLTNVEGYSTLIFFKVNSTSSSHSCKTWSTICTTALERLRIPGLTSCRNKTSMRSTMSSLQKFDKPRLFSIKLSAIADKSFVEFFTSPLLACSLVFSCRSAQSNC